MHLVIIRITNNICVFGALCQSYLQSAPTVASVSRFGRATANHSGEPSIFRHGAKDWPGNFARESDLGSAHWRLMVNIGTMISFAHTYILNLLGESSQEDAPFIPPPNFHRLLVKRRI